MSVVAGRSTCRSTRATFTNSRRRGSFTDQRLTRPGTNEGPRKAFARGKIRRWLAGITLAALWFVSTWMTYGLAAYFLGLPDSGGAVVGALMAAFVFMDPTGQLGSRSQ